MARWARLAPLTGIVFVVILAVSFALSGSTPGTGATGRHVIDYYGSHRGSQQASGFLGLYAVVFFLFFASTLRAYLRASLPGSALPTLSFGGAVLVAIGGTVFSSLVIALSDVPSKLSPGAAQALNVLANDFFAPLIAGTCVFMIANGLATLRSRALPVWLGWIAILIGIVAVTPIGFFGFLGLMGWTLIVSVLLLLRGRAAATPAAAAAT